MSFRVGQKVVCINGLFKDHRWHLVPHRPIEGGVYTVRGFSLPEYNAASDDPEHPKIYLVEVVNPQVKWTCGWHELAWPIVRFRPVVEKKTDISIFTEMLNPKQREHVSQ